jgi:hypothetical protein
MASAVFVSVLQSDVSVPTMSRFKPSINISFLKMLWCAVALNGFQSIFGRADEMSRLPALSWRKFPLPLVHIIIDESSATQ